MKKNPYPTGTKRTNEAIYKTLKKAKFKIRQRRYWTQDALARDKRNNPVDPKSKIACKWCAMGAIHAITSNEELIRECEFYLRELVERDSGYMGINKDDANYPTLSAFNYFNDDYAEYEDIIGVFEQAINELEE